MKTLIFDFEVFKYDTLLGALIIERDSVTRYQTWDLDEIRNFYYANKSNLWVGHNNIAYDNIILEAIVNKKNPYIISKKIVESRFAHKCSLPLITHDTMRGFYSLKTTEFIVGKNISETPIDFDLDRPLTEEERKQIESYNYDDISQTYENFIAQYDAFSIRLDIINEFNLPLKLMNVSGTKLAGIVLGAKAIPGIESMKVETKLPENIQIKNKDVIDFYLNEDFRKGKSINVILCGCEHNIAAGGIHAALKKIQVDRALYFDVSGYYNLIMINYNLLPRTMPKESREKYEYMYHEQLRLKKVNPQKRKVYKEILLCVFGAMLNKYTDFYDPYHGSLVTITGELFLVDLLEKLEGMGRIIQSNTDGIVFEPRSWDEKDAIIKIVEEWETRTGFVIKKEEIKNLWQRDVNNYVFDKNGTPEVKGEIVNAYSKINSPVWSQLWNSKEPPIIAMGIVDYLLYGVSPKETVEKNKRNLLLFQYPCKTLSFDYCQYEETRIFEEERTERIQHINRAFADNDTSKIGTVAKYKRTPDGGLKRTKVAGLPKNVFIYNDEIISKEAVDKLTKKIDYGAYVDRIYERLGEFT